MPKDKQSYVDKELDHDDLKTDHGYFLISRSFINSSTWLMGSNVITLAVYLISKAAHTPWKFPCQFQGKEVRVQRGEVLCSQQRMIREIKHLTPKEFRGAWGKLETFGFFENITPKCVKGAHSYTHVRLCKYEGYQDPKNYEGHVKGTLRAHEGQRSNELNELNECKESAASPRGGTSPARTPVPEPIKVFQQVAHFYPAKILWPQVQKVINGTTPEELTPYLAAWIARNYNPKNLGWLFDWYASREIPQLITENKRYSKKSQIEYCKEKPESWEVDPKFIEARKRALKKEGLTDKEIEEYFQRRKA